MSRYVNPGNPKPAESITSSPPAKSSLSNSFNLVSGLALCVSWDKVQLLMNKYMWFIEKRGLFFSHIRDLEVGRSG